MKTLLILALSFACVATAHGASARKSCDELKTEIAARIDANGVKSYTLEIVAADATGDAKIVGSCNGGEQRIAYRRGDSPALQSQQIAASGK